MAALKRKRFEGQGLQFPRTIEEFDPPLTDVEREVVEKTCAGEECTLGDGSRPEKASKERVVRASVIRYLALGGCDAHQTHEKGINLSGAFVVGRLDLELCKDVRKVGLFACYLPEGIFAREATIESFALDLSCIENGMDAESAKIVGNVILRNGHFVAGVNLSGAKIGGQLSCNHGNFQNISGYALNAEGAKIHSDVLIQKAFLTDGGVGLAGCQIGGQLSCNGSHFESQEDYALNFQNGNVKGHFLIRDAFVGKGGAFLLSAKIGGQFDCSGSAFHNLKGRALIAESANIKGSVFLRDGFSCNGEARFLGVEIGGQLNCSFGNFENESKSAFDVQDAKIKGLLVWRKVSIKSNAVSFYNAHISRIEDDAASWDVQQLRLEGLTYQSLGSLMSVERRLEWLARNNKGGDDFQPQPYQQLAKVYGEMGHRRDRGAVLMEMETRLRAWQVGQMWKTDHSPWGAVKVSFHWFFGNMSHLMVGYGHRPARSLIWAFVLIGLTWLVAWNTWHKGDFAPSSPHILVSDRWQALAKPLDKGGVANPAKVWTSDTDVGRDYETFHSLIYAVDVFIPLVDFGQEHSWSPSTTRGDWGWHLWWTRWIVEGLGWIITAMGAAAITGVIRNE